MKPIKLIVKNFGTFKEAEIDFEKLDKMFLIKGKTGSGKTTIFDAMMYALYGTFTGVRKGLKQIEMLSEYFTENEDAYSIFIFEVEDKKYRITRTLPLPPKTGKTTERPSKLTIENENEGKWVSAKLEVNEKTKKADANFTIEKIIGLTVDEFNQIVVLPQGEFANFLRENSNKRTDTLAKIFPVENIAKLTNNVIEKSKGTSDRLEKISFEIRAINKNGFNLSDLPKEIEKLSKEIELIEEKISKNNSEYNLTAEKIAKIKADLENAEKIEEIKKEIEKLESQRENMLSLEKKIELSKKARILISDVEKTKDAKNRLEDSNKKFEEAKSNFEKAKENFENLQNEKKEIEKLRNKNQNYEKEISELQEKLKRIKELEKAKKEKDEAEKILFDFKKSTEENKIKLENAKKEIEKLAKEFSISNTSEITENLLEQTHKLENERKNVEEILTTLKTFKKEYDKFSDFEKILNEIQSDFDKAKKINENNKKLLEEAEIQQKKYEQNHYAAILAKDLKQGCACPVCGSTTHTKIATDNEGLNPQEKLETAKENLKLSENALSNSEKELLNVKKDKENQEKICNDLKEKLSENANKEILEIEEKIESIKISEEKTKDALKNAKDLTKEIDKLLEEQSKNKEKENELSTNVKTAETKIIEQEKNIVGDKNENIEEKLSELQQIFLSEKEKITEFDENYKTAESEKDKSETLKNEREENSKKANFDLEEAQKLLSKKIEESEFKNSEDVEKNCMDLKEEENADKSLTKWKTDLTSNEETLKKINQSKDKDELKKELNKEKEKLEVLESDQKSFNSEIKEKSVELTTKNENFTRLSELNDEQKTLEKENSIYLKLKDDLIGKNPQRAAFESWVLAMYFAEVIEYANKRLSTLSRQRYQLRMKMTPDGKGKQGLELQIEDYAKGIIRPTQTLSGGETFQVSICLALAMTDVVCNRSGGIRLDALFIDEGFGSLDSESLDVAMKVLNEIQGQKMVGIISHVEAMENEIKSHIVVSKDGENNYSTVKIENL